MSYDLRDTAFFESLKDPSVIIGFSAPLGYATGYKGFWQIDSVGSSFRTGVVKMQRFQLDLSGNYSFSPGWHYSGVTNAFYSSSSDSSLIYLMFNFIIKNFSERFPDTSFNLNPTIKFCTGSKRFIISNYIIAGSVNVTRKWKISFDWSPSCWNSNLWNTLNSTGDLSLPSSGVISTSIACSY